MNRHQSAYMIFSLSLFLLFVIGSFFIITYEIRGYQILDTTCQTEDDLSVCLAYINTRLKANDSQGAIKVQQLDQVTCLQITTSQTTTYIYFQDGYLKELYTSNDYPANLSQGEPLFAITDFKIKQEGSSLYITVSKANQTKTSIIYLHS